MRKQTYQTFRSHTQNARQRVW